MASNCDNRNFDAMRLDFEVMKQAVDAYKQLGGRMPIPLATAFTAVEQTFLVGENFDAAFKSACVEMGNFLASNEEFCARFAGFGGKADMDKRGGERWQEVDNYYICMARHYYRQSQAEAVKKVLNMGDPKSFVSVFGNKTRQQIWGLVTKWAGERFKEAFSRSRQ